MADRLAELLGRPVTFADDCIGASAADAVLAAQGDSDVVLLENLRFHPEEEKNDPQFAAALASLADLYVDDAFGAAHRAHASVDAITRLLPKAAAGLLMEQELKYLGHVLQAPERPFVAIIGGAKVSDKLEVIENLLGKVDQPTSSAARWPTRSSRRAEFPSGSRSSKTTSSTRPARSKPTPHAGTSLPRPAHRSQVVADRFDANAATAILKVGDARIGDRLGVDIGPDTIKAYESLLADAKTVIWKRPDGRLRGWTRSPLARTPWRKAVAGDQRHDHRRRRRFDCRGQERWNRGSHHAHFHGRRRVARIPRRPARFPGVAALTDK